MTRKTRAQERADEIDISPTTLIAQIEELSNQLVAANRQSDEYLSALQRERAEFLNFKRRTAEERERDFGLANDDLIRKVLAVADDFDRAIDARPEEFAGNANIAQHGAGQALLVPTVIDGELRWIAELGRVPPEHLHAV